MQKEKRQKKQRQSFSYKQYEKQMKCYVFRINEKRKSRYVKMGMNVCLPGLTKLVEAEIT